MTKQNFEGDLLHQSPMMDMLFHPYRTMQAVFEFVSAWIFTRETSALIGFLPVLIFVLIGGGMAGYGWLSSSASITANIALLVEEEFKRTDANGSASDGDQSKSQIIRQDDSLAPQQITPFAEMLLKRLVQNEGSDSRWRYLVALQLGQRERLGQARQMMRKLAPKRGNGFPPAHAWLAVDSITRNKFRVQEDKLDLIKDLENASNWTGMGPALHATLAELQESEGRIADAIKSLENGAKNDANLQVNLVGLALRHGRTQIVDEASVQAVKLYQAKISEKRANAQDYLQFANLCLMLQDTEQAIRITAEAEMKFPGDKQLIRARSEAFRVKYLQSIAAGLECDINALDAAHESDPSNPAVMEEVAKLLAAGTRATAALEKALQMQLAAGKGTAMTHLLLSQRALSKKQFANAIPHLEVALRQAPNSPVILNNLAVSLVRQSTDNLPRARELIDRAVAIANTNAEFLDSQGQIRMLGGDFVGAVESFENAIGMDGTRIATRKLLVNAYEKAGMRDMAHAQRRELEKLQNAAQVIDQTPTP